MGKSARPFWVFGYGSLMWNPGFATHETRGARLHGWHRAFCIYSEHYRGTPKQPGLILGLLPGGACRGLAHRLPAKQYDAVRRYLIHREIDNDGVYEETIRPIHLDDGRTVPALVYLADRAHRQFAGKLPLAKAVALVRRGNGATGSNLAYVQNTVAHLTEMGLRDRQLAAGLLDRQAEPLAQHDPALGRQRQGERVQRALARVGGQRRQLVLEPAGKLHAVGGVHLHDHVGRLGGASLQRLDEGPHRQQALAALGALVDDRGDALVDRPRNVETHFAESGGQHTAEHGDVELGGVGEMLEHGARRDARHLGDVADDGRHLTGERQGKGGADDGVARSGDTIAAGGSL